MYCLFISLGHIPVGVVIQGSMASPAISNPAKNSIGTNGGGLTRSDCTYVLSLVSGSPRFSGSPRVNN